MREGKHMNVAKKFFIAVLLSALPALAAAQTLTEPTVKELIASIDKAIAAKDVNGIAQHMTDNVEITVVISSGGRTQKSKLSKPDYVKALRDTWGMATNYMYRRSNETIVINNNVATVSADVVENMTINNQHSRTRTRETATIELINGVPKITKITGSTSI